MILLASASGEKYQNSSCVLSMVEIEKWPAHEAEDCDQEQEGPRKRKIEDVRLM